MPKGNRRAATNTRDSRVICWLLHFRAPVERGRHVACASIRSGASTPNNHTDLRKYVQFPPMHLATVLPTFPAEPADAPIDYVEEHTTFSCGFRPSDAACRVQRPPAEGVASAALR